mgnify:CR=1 FL=1
MTDLTYALLQLGVMALVTYLIRMLPMTLFTRKIRSRFLRSFLYYVPYAVLGAMTFPAIFFSTRGIVSGLVGTLVALILAFCRKGLLTVAVSACAAVFLTNLLLTLF